MKIRVHICPPDLRCASVHISDLSWFDRVVLGREERDFHAVGEIAINGGIDWYADGLHSFRRITDRRVLAELHLAHYRADRDERWRALHARRG